MPNYEQGRGDLEPSRGRRGGKDRKSIFPGQSPVTRGGRGGTGGGRTSRRPHSHRHTHPHRGHAGAGHLPFPGGAHTLPDIDDMCNGNGVWVQDWLTGSGYCNCNVTYAGNYCQYSDVVNCSANGVVNDDGSCNCYSGYCGFSCETQC